MILLTEAEPVRGRPGPSRVPDLRPSNRSPNMDWLSYYSRATLRRWEGRMGATRSKTLNYLRAQWLDLSSAARTLESYTREAYKKLSSVEERTIERDSGQLLRTIAVVDHNHRVLIHLTADTPGEQASIVPHATSGAAQISVTTIPPPNHAEFMDGDAFIFISRNDVCICASAIREVTIANFFYHLFKKAQLSTLSEQFVMLKVADVDALSLIQKNKVSEVRLKATVFQATADYVRRQHQSHSLISAAARQIRQLAGKPHDVTPDGLQIELVIKADRRDRKHLNVAEAEIEEIATGLIMDKEVGDKSTIVLSNGQKISEDQIYTKSSVDIPSLGKSVDRDKAWDALIDFYSNIKNSGITEQ